MPELCFITTCMGRLSHLQQTLPAAVAQPGCSCIVVDYSCPERCGDWVERYYPTVKVVRVPDQQYFSATIARNRGAAAATAPWLCFFDADALLQPEFAPQMLPRLQADNYYLVRPWERELVGTMICPRDAFMHVGGYDEVYQIWAEEDVDLYDRFQRHGLVQQSIPRNLVEPIRHDDALRVQHSVFDSHIVSQTINYLYRTAKFDLMRLQNRDLTYEERQQLYAEVGRLVQRWVQNNQASEFRIVFRQGRSIFGQELTATLVYTLNPLRQAPP